jgi:ATP-binding cassette, subfamily F, member 3
LSGGEKSRVALAKTLISEANFLLLDEPTNHLDFISENILIQALQQYKGAFVVVSHNRHFVTQIANKIWYIEDKQIKEYPGTYDEYEYWRKKNEEAGLKAEPPKVKKVEVEAKPKVQSSPSNDAKIKTLEKELKKVEDQMSTLEQQKANIEAEMAKPEVFSNFEKLKEVQTTFKKVENELQAVTQKWEEVATSIDALNAR